MQDLTHMFDQKEAKILCLTLTGAREEAQKGVSCSRRRICRIFFSELPPNKAVGGNNSTLSLAENTEHFLAGQNQDVFST